jgi:TatD DNase family protein
MDQPTTVRPKATENERAGPPLVDCHTHLAQYEPEELPGILQRARASGIGLIIAASTTLVSCISTLNLSNSHPAVRAGVGLHPMDLEGPLDDATWSRLRELAQHPAVVVWSETGLDYLPTSPGHSVQHDAFRHQIRLAKEMGLPLVVHSRESDDDVLRLLREERADEVGGAWHYFQGSLATAHAALEMGFHISLAKPLLRLPDLQKVVAQLPMERIVLETDSFPQPFKKHRERWTEPWHLPQVAAKLAELHGISIDAVAEITTKNALAMLRGRVTPDDLILSAALPA